MEKKLQKHIDLLIERYPKLESVTSSIISAYEVMEECYSHDHKLLVAGNGGSAADSEHIVGELMKNDTGTTFADLSLLVYNAGGFFLWESIKNGDFIYNMCD